MLRRGRAKPFWYHHPWVFSGAIARVEGDPPDGHVVDVVESGGRFVARGFFNSASQIRVRLCTWRADERVDADFFTRRIAAACELRRLVALPSQQTDAYRLVHGEGDSIPGLIVDVFGPVVAVQFSARGLEAFEDVILDAIEERLRPSAVVERPSVFSQAREGGAADEQAVEPKVRRGRDPGRSVEFREHGIVHSLDPFGGQKTGFYLDQRDNRALLAGFVAGRRMFDGFCYTGAFALAAARLGGAAEVVAVDRSEAAIEAGRAAAARNGIGVVKFEAADVVARLRDSVRAGERFDVVAIDPPKLAPSSGDLDRAISKYRELNRAAIRAVRPGGLLASSSCSGRIDGDSFIGILHEAGQAEGRTLRILYRRYQGPDHPVVVSCPESEYLKFVICRIESE